MTAHLAGEPQPRPPQRPRLRRNRRVHERLFKEGSIQPPPNCRQLRLIPGGLTPNLSHLLPRTHTPCHTLPPALPHTYTLSHTHAITRYHTHRHTHGPMGTGPRAGTLSSRVRFGDGEPHRERALWEGPKERPQTSAPTGRACPPLSRLATSKPRLTAHPFPPRLRRPGVRPPG